MEPVRDRDGIPLLTAFKKCTRGANKTAAKRREGGPNRDEMAQALLEYIKINDKERLKSSLIKLMEAEEYKIIFTPPYCPWTQPIELIWAYVKSRVAYDWTPKRKWKDALRSLYRAFYSGESKKPGKPHKGCSPAMCRRLVFKTFRNINDAILMDEVLSGTYDNLYGVTDAIKAECGAGDFSSLDVIDDEYNEEIDADGNESRAITPSSFGRVRRRRLFGDEIYQ